MANKNNDKKVGTVYETTNYDQFKHIEDNRDVHATHLKGLVSSIKEVGGNIQAIVVNKAFEVLDGNHRLNACRELGVAVRYTILKPQQYTNEKLMMELNNASKNWSLENYAKHFAHKYSEYKTLCSIADDGIGFQGACQVNGIPTPSVRKGKKIVIPADYQDRLEAIVEMKRQFKLKTGKQMRSQAAAGGIAEILKRKEVAIKQGNKLAHKFNILDAVKHFQKAVPDTGINEDKNTVAKMISKSYDLSKRGSNKLYLVS